ncbi:MAG: hypothetical protein KTR20_12850 [Cellvibrionaceae bacterium]|nr:hypothetical protein [Cellvibrionaceae bacterium]
MTEILAFADLLKKENGRRSFVHSIVGLGDVKMYELTSLEAQACFIETNELSESDVEIGQDSIARWASWMIKGAKPTKEEVMVMRQKYSVDVLLSIRDAGLNYSGETQAGKEELEKN